MNASMKEDMRELLWVFKHVHANLSFTMLAICFMTNCYHLDESADSGMAREISIQFVSFPKAGSTERSVIRRSQHCTAYTRKTLKNICI